MKKLTVRELVQVSGGQRRRGSSSSGQGSKGGFKQGSGRTRN